MDENARQNAEPWTLAATAQRRIWLLETLHAVHAFVAAQPDAESALQQIAEEIFARFRFTSAAIGVIDGDTLVFRGIAGDLPLFQRSLPLESGVCGRVVRTGRGELIDDVTQDADYVIANFAVAREIAVPIVVDGVVYGVLNIESAADEPLGREEYDVMVSLATSLGLAIERARHSAAEARRMEQFAALQQLSGRIAGRIQNDAEFNDILSEINTVLDFAGTSLGLLDGDGIMFYSSYARLTEIDALLVRMAATDGVVGRVIRTGEPAFVTDVDADPDYVRYRPYATQEICVPLRAGQDVIGVLNVEQDNRRAIDETDLHLVQLLVDHIGMALANRRRIEDLERRNQQLQTVERVTAIIASKLLVREAIPEIVEEIEVGFGFGSAFITEIEGDRLMLRGVRQRLADDNMFYLEHGVPLTDGVIGRVARTGEPAFLPDARSDPDFLETSPEVQSEICVPIKIQERTIGVINVETPASRPLVAGDLEVLTIIAHHLGMALEKCDLYLAERHSRKAVEAIQRVSSIVASTLDPDEALRLIVELLAASFDYPVVTFRLLEDGLLVLQASIGTEIADRPLALRVGDGVVGRVAETGESAFVADVAREPAYVSLRHDVTSEIAVPIHSGVELAGVLNIEGTAERPLTIADLELLKTFAEHAGTLLNNARMYERMEQLASSDPITDLPNYREFHRRLDEELHRAERYNRPLSLMVIDLDHFKQINDEFGHLAGDDVLRAIGHRINDVLRQTDLLARYAGDEFVVILPESDHEAAEATAWRLQQAVSSEPFIVRGHEPRSLQLSVGIATYPTDGTDPETLIKRADDGMYAEKAASRRVRIRPIDDARRRPPDDAPRPNADRNEATSS
jgi:diguanylate cyclase (GGDEF)-like protein